MLKTQVLTSPTQTKYSVLRFVVIHLFVCIDLIVYTIIPSKRQNTWSLVILFFYDLRL